MSDNGKKDNSGKKIGAVMVVGGGISGIQSALDLANSGFKVYLVEEDSAIGGRMAQLDKTFPTNDCSMCMISPKLIEVEKHPNIQLMTNSQVEAIEGEEGNFKVKIRKKPRYIDEDKCSGCGDCAEACPVSLANEFEQGLNKRKAVYKRYPQAVPSTVCITKNSRPPCTVTCPAGCNGQGYTALISQGKYVEAVDLIKQTIPLPGTLGRICFHPCEAKCHRGEIEQSIAIRPLKRFAADIVRQKRESGEIPPESKPTIDLSKPKIGIVGSGPSGLTCAYKLAKLGYPVTIFEADTKPGGQLQSSIPRYRLPEKVLAAEIQDIINLGIELKLNTCIGQKLTLADLKKQGYQAVYIAVGAQKSQTMKIPGADLTGVIPALDFLKKINQGKQVKPGEKVAIIGGGNVALDAARTALRSGSKKVSMMYRRTRDEMPGSPEEVEAALEEGVEINFLAAPLKIESKNGKLNLTLNRMKLGEPDSSGRRQPVPIEGSEFSVEVDTIIAAIGQTADFSLLSQTNIKTTRSGWIAVDPITFSTDEAGIFAGGDAVAGPSTAVEAINHGQEAAVSIDRYLNKTDLKESREKAAETPAAIPDGKHLRQYRIKMNTIPLESRLKGFNEVEIGYTEEEAKKESKRCLNCGLCSECLQCVAVCKAKAIIHDMKEQILDIPVGSVILTPGFEPFDARLKGEYGYGRMPNVVTSLEFERILSASGPFQGQVKRPSDGKHPVKIAWIQCVGSRDKSCGNDYCSSVCCMYATKEAIIAREHDSKIQPTIFYNDLRAFGKGFERYYESAKNTFGVNYVNSIPSMVKERQQTHNLSVSYTDPKGQKVEDEFDLVVLSIGLRPSPSTKGLASKLGIALDRFGFCQTEDLKPNTASRPGIYVAGAFDTPMDIPESVISASGAASLASQGIAEVRGTMVTEKQYPVETDIKGQEPRVGVFICRCGTNIARVVNVSDAVEYTRKLPYVAYAEENLYTCSSDTQKKITEAIKNHELNRVVVASCSPRTHETLFQNAIREAGLNKYLFEMANIRDQCSWVHASHIPEANNKAKDLIRMAVARAATLQPVREFRSPVIQSALIIGGGLSGMTAALGLAAQGFNSVLVEREKELGGNLKHIYSTFNGSDAQKYLSGLIKQVESEPRIKIYKNANIKSFSGYVGNFKTQIITGDKSEETYLHGVAIVATGGAGYKPSEYHYGNSSKVITQTELEEKLATDGETPKNLKSVVMIQCVGSREGEHMYCSRICCSQAVKNAIKLKEINPDTEVYVLYRDIRTYGMHELKYQEARDKGVTFIRYNLESKPEVKLENDKLDLKVLDQTLGTSIELNPDLLVLSTAIRPQPDAAEFAAQLKLPLTQDKFLMEAHMKLRPVDVISEGIFICGLAHSPKSVTESIVQARGAVSRASTILSKSSLMVSGVISVVDPNRCVTCLTCVRSCPFGVPRINNDLVAYIEPAACQGCGICVGACPRKAIMLQHYSEDQVDSKSNALCVS